MRAGDDIYVERGSFPHHGIYVHDQQVIHSDNTATISCTTLKLFAEGGEVQVKQYGEERCFDFLEVIERAKSEIGRPSNHSFEHFAAWCITGDADEQVEEAAGSNSLGLVDGYRLHSLLPETEGDVSVLPLLFLVTSTEDLGGSGEGPIRRQVENDLRQGPVSDGGRILDSLKANTPEWRAMLAGVLLDQDLTPAVLGFACSVMNPLMPSENVGSPRINNRIDGVLDMLNCEFSASDAQGLFQDVCKDLAEASQSETLRRSVSTGAFVTSFALGCFGLWGGQVTRGIAGAGDFVRRNFTKDHEYVSTTSLLTTVALLLLQQGTATEVKRIRRELGQQLSEAGRELKDLRSKKAQVEAKSDASASELQSIPRHLIPMIKDKELKQRVTRRALEILAPDEGTDEASEEGVPDLVGLSLEDAERVLATHGLTSEAIDVNTTHGGAPRHIGKAANWTVVSQLPVPGTPAQVGHLKLTVGMFAR